MAGSSSSPLAAPSSPMLQDHIRAAERALSRVQDQLDQVAATNAEDQAALDEILPDLIVLRDALQQVIAELSRRAR